MDRYDSSPVAPLIPSQGRSHCIDREVSEQGCYRGEIIEEVKRQLGLALPLIAVSILQYCLQIISIMFVGHLGELPLSSASMATSFASVTGFNVLEWEVHWKRYVDKLMEPNSIACLASIRSEG